MVSRHRSGMVWLVQHIFSSTSEADTIALARRFSAALQSGDALLLDGPVGAGKSVFARAVIRARMGAEIDVPSPTFTLVQQYQPPSGPELWHMDLYRLGDLSELEELGLEPALTTGITLIEWSARLGTRVPEEAIFISFTPGRNVTERRIIFEAPRHVLMRCLEATDGCAFE